MPRHILYVEGGICGSPVRSNVRQIYVAGIYGQRHTCYCLLVFYLTFSHRNGFQDVCLIKIMSLDNMTLCWHTKLSWLKVVDAFSMPFLLLT